MLKNVKKVVEKLMENLWTNTHDSGQIKVLYIKTTAISCKFNFRFLPDIDSFDKISTTINYILNKHFLNS